MKINAKNVSQYKNVSQCKTNQQFTFTSYDAIILSKNKSIINHKSNQSIIISKYIIQFKYIQKCIHSIYSCSMVTLASFPNELNCLSIQENNSISQNLRHFLKFDGKRCSNRKKN